jgi:hypothetical protein
MAMSNNQRGPVGLSAGDWVRLQRLRASKNYVTANLEDNVDIYSPSRVGVGRIRRPASMWSDYRASQTADFVTSASTGLNGNIFTTTRVCNCQTDTQYGGPIQDGTDITACQNTKEFKLYTFTPPTSGTYTINVFSVGGSDPDLFISYANAHLDTGYIAANDGEGDTSALYSDTSGGTSTITEAFEGGQTYEVMVLQWTGNCFNLTVTEVFL